MDIEREIKVRDAIKYCIENFDSKTATNRIVEFWKDELKLQEKQCNIHNVAGQSEQFVCDCANNLEYLSATTGVCKKCDNYVDLLAD